MRPVNQLPLSLIAMNCSPLASSRKPDNPPKPRNGEVSTSPERYCSAPKRVRARSRVSNAGIARAWTSSGTGAVTENSSGARGFADSFVAVCAYATAGRSPAAAEEMKPRRVKSLPSSLRDAPLHAEPESKDRARLVDSGFARGARAPECRVMRLRVQPARPLRRRRRRAMRFAEQFGELFGDGPAEFLRVDDGHCAPIVARHVVADTDRDQFDRRTGLDLLDDMAQMTLEIVAGIDRQRRV